MILDVHTHNPQHPQGSVISLGADTPVAALPAEGCYSVGVHPWSTAAGGSVREFENLIERIERDEDLRARLVAIGEAGIDALRGAPVAEQQAIFRRQVEVSERLRLPMIIHAVRSWNELIDMRRELRPEQPWVVHGFRGKPQLARQLAGAGFYLSFGEQFNPEALRVTPPGRRLAETDDSPLGIEQIISLQAAALGTTEAAHRAALAATAAEVFKSRS